jgi:hypothetical protein
MADEHPFAELAGTWRGEGAGSYPTLADPFTYTEELVVEPVPGRPVAHWRSRTRDAVTGEPRHAESGFLRSAGEGGVELVLAHSFGIVEVGAGTLRGGVLEVESGELVGTASAKEVTGVRRRYRFGESGVSYDIAMAAVGVAMTHHLRATLQSSVTPA